MVPYSRRLFSQQGVTDPTVCFTVPPGQVWIVRSIDCYCGAPLVSSQLIFKEYENSAAFLSFTTEAGTSRSFQWEGRQVFEAGQSLEADPADHAWDIRVSGYELAGA